MHPSRLIAAGFALLAVAAFGWWWGRGDARDDTVNRPCLAVEPTALDFGALPVDGLWLARVEVRNCGPGAVEVVSPVFEGPFVQVGRVDEATVAPGRTQVITVGFAPDTVGFHHGAATLSIDGIPPVRVMLAGEGVIGDRCPPLITGLEAGVMPTSNRNTLCPPLDAPVLLDGAGLRLEPAVRAAVDGPSI